MDETPGMSRGFWISLIIYLVGLLTGFAIGVATGLAI
jgi:uncharacterized membrane protein